MHPQGSPLHYIPLTCSVACSMTLHSYGTDLSMVPCTRYIAGRLAASACPKPVAKCSGLSAWYAGFPSIDMICPKRPRYSPRLCRCSASVSRSYAPDTPTKARSEEGDHEGLAPKAPASPLAASSACGNEPAHLCPLQPLYGDSRCVTAPIHSF